MHKIVKGSLSFLYNITSSLLRISFSTSYYIIIFLIICSLGAIFFATGYLKSPGPLQAEKNVVIKPGTSVVSIARLLEAEGIIELPHFFSLLIKMGVANKSLKAGEYSFNKAVSPIEVLHKIEAGDVVIRRITIPEGYTTHQVLENIKEDPMLKGMVPEYIGEGELLPQTYEYTYGDSRIAIVRRMQEAMQKTLNELWEKRQENLPIHTKEQALVLASIIEKETGIKEERKKVAAVFINRIKKNMRLQTDPSVIYAITNGKYILPRPLTLKDLEFDSPYNTYKYSGLPPTPIANPGAESIEAALNPEATEDLYFVADGTGGHKFAKTLEEHNKNVKNWRKVNTNPLSKEH